MSGRPVALAYSRSSKTTARTRPVRSEYWGAAGGVRVVSRRRVSCPGRRRCRRDGGGYYAVRSHRRVPVTAACWTNTSSDSDAPCRHAATATGWHPGAPETARSPEHVYFDLQAGAPCVPSGQLVTIAVESGPIPRSRSSTPERPGARYGGPAARLQRLGTSNRFPGARRDDDTSPWPGRPAGRQ